LFDSANATAATFLQMQSTHIKGIGIATKLGLTFKTDLSGTISHKK
jgi:hypothetical protein